MVDSFDYLEGKKFCIVFVKVLDEESGKVQLQTLHGRASVDNGRVSCITPEGASFTVPNTALRNILPSDGTELLKDAEYYALGKTDKDIDFFT